MVKLAHLSDPHLPLPKVRFSDLAGKRFLGFHSWHLNRKTVHDPQILAAAVDDIRRHEPDQIAVTGDLTNIALPAEFVNAGKWLAELAPPERVAVIPGNHDAYVKMPWSVGPGLWQANMCGEYAVTGGELDNGFPYVRVRKNVAVIALSSSMPTGWFIAGGRISERQLARLKELLPRLGQQGFFRTILMHHPPLPNRIGLRRSLWNAADLRDVLREEGAELVLHGHDHAHMHERIETAAGVAHVFGVPSVSARKTRRKPPAAWNLYDIRREDGSWRCDVRVRSLDADAREFREFRHFAVKFD